MLDGDKRIAVFKKNEKQGRFVRTYWVIKTFDSLTDAWDFVHKNPEEEQKNYVISIIAYGEID